LVDGATANGLTKLLMGSLGSKGGLNNDATASKLVCFGADSVSAFQGKRIGVTIQIKHNFAPHATVIHCLAHKINLAVKTLSQLAVFHEVEELMQISHVYFSHSPKKFQEYKSFASTSDTKGPKVLKNVTTRWLSLLTLMKRIMSEFRTILGKLDIDCLNKKEMYVHVFLLSIVLFLCNGILFGLAMHTGWACVSVAWRCILVGLM
jgi:hypothetical protein